MVLRRERLYDRILEAQRARERGVGLDSDPVFGAEIDLGDMDVSGVKCEGEGGGSRLRFAC